MPKAGKDGETEEFFVRVPAGLNHRCVRIYVLDNVFYIFDFEESNIKGDCVVGKVCVILQ